MTRPCVFALGLGLGAWTVVAAMHLAARYSGTHYLAVTIKEQP
jgi:hypothetical protein